jgi:hypothetical protein
MCHELFYCAKRAREYNADKNTLTKTLIDLGITGTTNKEIEKQIALLLLPPRKSVDRGRPEVIDRLSERRF